MSVCALVLSAHFARAQQFDVAASGSTLYSSKNTTASESFLPPAERGSVYPGANLDRVFDRFGYSAEFSFRYHEGIYNDYQKYRPVLYDVNFLFEPRLKGVFPAGQAKRLKVDFLGGMGGETVIYSSPFGSCVYAGSGCSTHLDSNHFLLHGAAEIRYRFWRQFFVRPEAHYYHIFNNTSDFHSDNVFRVGVSVGYTFHTD